MFMANGKDVTGFSWRKVYAYKNKNGVYKKTTGKSVFDPQREEIKKATAAYLKKGGKIKQIESNIGHTNNVQTFTDSLMEFDTM